MCRYLKPMPLILLHHSLYFFETRFLPEPITLHFCLTVWPGNLQNPLPPHPNTEVTHIPHHTRLGALQLVSRVNNQNLLLWCPKHPKHLLCTCSPQQGHLQLEPTINSPISFLAWPNTLFKHMELTTMASAPSGFESGNQDNFKWKAKMVSGYITTLFSCLWSLNNYIYCRKYCKHDGMV